MPLRDHFRPPLYPRHHWEGMHAAWPTYMVAQLKKSLPKGYFAEPRVHLGTFCEVDVGAFENVHSETTLPLASEGGLFPASEATLTLEVDLTDPSEYEVLIFDQTAGRRLVAAIEIVSPANKDRLEHRRAFVGKCAELIRQQVCVVIVDIVTVRLSNLYLELLDYLGATDPTMSESSPAIYAASCRSRMGLQKTLLRLDRHPLRLDQSLPVLPVWLTEDFSIPLDLEVSYEVTCDLLLSE